VERVLGAGLGPDVVDAAAPLIGVIKRAWLLEYPCGEGFVIAAEGLQPPLSCPPCYLFKVLLFQEQPGARSVAAPAALPAAEALPKEGHTGI